MATPFEKLAQSLEQLRRLQNEKGIAVFRASDLSRTHKDRLVANGFLKEVIRGWYISTRPDEHEGNTTSWYMLFWYFASVYMNSRFGKDWCISPEQSLSLHSGNFSVPKQLLVRSPKAQNNVISLLHGTSFFDLKLSLPQENERSEKDGIQVFSIAAGLLACAPDYFANNSTDARTCLSMIKDASDILSLLLERGHSVKAGRLIGAFRNVGNNRIADDILDTMKSAGYDVREDDPFRDKPEYAIGGRDVSPYATRIRLMWHKMRPTVLEYFPSAQGLPIDKNSILKQIDDLYVTDAYHSLSIEGYQVTSDLIERVRSGHWNPEEEKNDKNQKDAMAARGYWQAFQAVKNSISEILNGKNPGEVADMAHGIWYRELFAPSVAAGILKASDLAGYRTSQVYIKGSMHTPFNKDAVRDAMPVLFDLLKEETEACVRAVLGHFIFVYIHPYMDGNGRISRFLMNAMLISGGYSWTIIPTEQRNEYLSALEQASVYQNITDFTKFLVNMVKQG
ncbi:MAG: cell filamentation protein Fic [Mariniphaga sp.]|nr:cell filamentation protein Fic [Mariniphaga sp.]